MTGLLPFISRYLVSGKLLSLGSTSLAQSVYALPRNTDVPGSSTGGDKDDFVCRIMLSGWLHLAPN